MSKETIFVTENAEAHIEAAKLFTKSEGFMADAVAIGAYRQREDASVRDLVGVAVFEGFRGGEAELHFGMAPGNRLSRDLLLAVNFVAFHEKALGLSRIRVHIPSSNVEALCAALRVGFQIEYRQRASFGGAMDAIILTLSRADVLAALEPAETEVSAA